MISRAVQQAMTIVLAVILVRMIRESEFGTYRQALLVYTFLGGVLSLQLATSLYYFVPKLPGEQRPALLLQTFGFSLAVAAAIGALMFASAGLIARLFDNPALAPLIRLMSLFPLADRFGQLIPSFMISADRAVRGGVYVLLLHAGRVAAVVGAIAAGHALFTAMSWMIAAVGLVAAIGCADMVRLSRGGTWSPRWSLAWEQWRFTWPLWVTALIAVVNVQLDKLIISSFFDPATYAVYSCGAMQIPLVAVVTASLSAAMMPNLVSLMGEGRTTAALRLWQEGARKCSFLILPAFVLFLVVATDLMVFLYGEPYRMAAWPFRVYLFMLPLRVTVYATMFRAMGETKPISISAGIALGVNVVISFTLVVVGRGTVLGLIGPSIGTVVATLASTAYLLQRLTGLVGVGFSRVMRWKEVGRVLALSAVCGLLMLLVPVEGLAPILRLLIRGAAFATALLLVLLATGTLNAEERRLLGTPLRVIRRRLRRPETS
jgi:O-antigen/teichoic acid export membrane protein